jgi:hypothetical protein
MSFAAGRDPKSSKRSGTGGEATPPGRNTNPREEVPVSTNRTIEEGTPISVLAAARDADLAEAAEQMDRGLRLAMPMLFDTPAAAVSEENPAVKFDGLGGTVNPELSELIVAKVDDARVILREAMNLAEAGNDRAAGIAIADEVENVSALTALLIERGQA